MKLVALETRLRGMSNGPVLRCTGIKKRMFSHNAQLVGNVASGSVLVHIS